MSLVSFIKTLASLVSNSQNLIYVLGNTSADYDSIVGSIIYAYYLTNLLKIPHIPLIDCQQKDIPIRFQLNYIFKRHSIDPKDLIYYSNINKNQNTSFVLYDHNQRKNLKVRQILDHHDYNHLSCQRALIYPVGSCLTLLYYLLNPTKLMIIKDIQNQHWKDNLKNKFTNFTAGIQHPFQKYDPIIDQFIRYGVLIDCINFDQKQKDRWTIYDLQAIKSIESQNKYQIGYNQLMDIKFNQEISVKLSVKDHLLKDYKKFSYFSKELQQFYQIHYSTIILSPRKFFQRYHQQVSINVDQIIQSSQMQQNITQKNVAYLLMFAHKKQGKIKRHLSFKSNDQLLTSKLQKLFSNLNLIEEQPFAKGWANWHDPSCLVTRKIVDKNIRQKL